MPTHVAIQPGQLYPQPGYSVQIDKEGKWTATQVFLCHRTSAVALMPRPGTPHPEIGFITVSQATANFTEGDLAEITCQYAGAEEQDEDKEKANAVYTMGLSLSEEPLLSHLRYKQLAQKEREAIQLIQSGKDKDDQGNKLRDKVTSDRGKEALGQDRPRPDELLLAPRDLARKLGAHEAGGGGRTQQDRQHRHPVRSRARRWQAGRNWLRNGVTQTQEGKAFRLELEWLASDRGGWDADIYND